MARATGKIGSAMPFEAADGDLAGGVGGGCHNAAHGSEEREREREREKERFMSRWIMCDWLWVWGGVDKDMHKSDRRQIAPATTIFEW